MRKFSMISKVAATAILGAVLFTGCGSSSSTPITSVENNETRDDNENVNDFNVTFVYNYQPWQGDWYKDGNSTILARHVTEIRFKKDITSPVIRLYICIQSPDVIIDKNDESDPNDNRYLTLCKEKAIF